MTAIATDTATLDLPAEQVFSFLADLSNHRAFLEPEAKDFSGDVDSHRYKLEVMGMTMPVEALIGEKIPPTLVTLVPGAKKMFDHTLRFEITPAGGQCQLRIVDEADLPAMMKMMGAEKLLKGQLDNALAKIQELAKLGKLGFPGK
ncbi:MAG: SRPBCC family protein [Acidobacteriota bacterium]|nr:SRPBCC family protein [Acidobacteriota bacterium]